MPRPPPLKVCPPAADIPHVKVVRTVFASLIVVAAAGGVAGAAPVLFGVAGSAAEVPPTEAAGGSVLEAEPDPLDESPVDEPTEGEPDGGEAPFGGDAGACAGLTGLENALCRVTENLERNAARGGGAVTGEAGSRYGLENARDRLAENLQRHAGTGTPTSSEAADAPGPVVEAGAWPARGQGKALGRGGR